MSILARSVIGVDLRIDEARRRSPELSFLEHDCNRPFPFPSGSVDVIISVNLIEHLADYRTCLEECARTLRTGGRIAMTTANLGFFLHDHFFDPTHVREWTLQEFGELMNQYFTTTILEKSSGMFKYYPINWVTTLFLKPDLLFVGVKG
jgi:SAM-dependent methyltransferase